MEKNKCPAGCTIDILESDLKEFPVIIYQAKYSKLSFGLNLNLQKIFNIF